MKEEETHKAYALASIDKIPAKELGHHAHRVLEGLPAVFSILTILAVLVGSIIEIIPALTMQEFMPRSDEHKPYTALELAGRDLFVREGCYTCHSQMIRPMMEETLRYGKPSTIAESQYDRPFQWGSKRTGPDLARVGGNYPDMWHYRHMMNPRDIVPQSIMPNYPWLGKDKTDFDIMPQKLGVMKTLGVPYTDKQVSESINHAKEQAKVISDRLREGGVQDPDLESREIVALIAYLQRLGKPSSDFVPAAEMTAASSAGGQ